MARPLPTIVRILGTIRSLSRASQVFCQPKLGIWARSQRYARRMEEEKPTSTTDERIRALDAIGFDWGIRRTDLASNWSERVGQLCKFKAQFGHCRVPARYSTNPRLA